MSQFVREKKGSVVRDDISISSQTMLNDIFIEKVKPSQILIDRKHSWSGWKCWAGIDMVNIDMWGNMYRADCQYGGPIGNLERYKLPTDIITCGKEICACCLIFN